jgi:hypothetical protein
VTLELNLVSFAFASPWEESFKTNNDLAQIARLSFLISFKVTHWKSMSFTLHKISLKNQEKVVDSVVDGCGMEKASPVTSISKLHLYPRPKEREME